MKTFSVVFDGGERQHVGCDGCDVGQRRTLSDDRRKDIQRRLRPERPLAHVQLRHVQLLGRVCFQGDLVTHDRSKIIGAMRFVSLTFP